MTTRLITSPREETKWTARRETDAADALVRGLAEYLADLRAEVAGREIKVRAPPSAGWPQGAPPDAELPALTVHTGDQTGRYGADDNDSPLGPKVLNVEVAPGVYPQVTGAFNQPLVVELWCATPSDRRALSAAIEDAMFPVDWMLGVRLELGHYHGAQARYTLVDATRRDSAEDAQARLRKQVFTVASQVALVRLAPRKRADFRTRLELAE